MSFVRDNAVRSNLSACVMDCSCVLKSGSRVDMLLSLSVNVPDSSTVNTKSFFFSGVMSAISVGNRDSASAD